MNQLLDIPVGITAFDPALCQRHTWLVLLRVDSVPPHVGLMIDGNYNSLTLKGAEMNVSATSLLRLIGQRTSASAFVRIARHPVFSDDYQLAAFQEILKTHGAVRENSSTCLSPLKDFFQEFYALPYDGDELLPGLLQRLCDNGYAETAMLLNTSDNSRLKVPYYTAPELRERIRTERLPFYTD